MSPSTGVLRNGDIGDKLATLALRFQQFNFPNTLEIVTEEQRLYREAVTDLWAMDFAELEKIEEESWQEWNLGLDMGQELETGAYYLVQFTKRVNDALNATYEELGEVFNAAQTPMSDILPDDPLSITESTTAVPSGRTFGKVDSFSTLIESPPPSPDYLAELGLDYPPEYFEEDAIEFSPSSSLKQLALETSNSPKRRRLMAEDNTVVSSFQQRLQAQIPPPPVFPTSTSALDTSHRYIFGKLPFSVDWEVSRIAHHNSLEIEQFGRVMHSLQENIQNPETLWKILQACALEIKQEMDALLGDFELATTPGFRMPPKSSNMVWQTLGKDEGWYSGRVHLGLAFSSTGAKLTLTPHPMRISSSRRAYRKFGADRFLNISIGKEFIRAENTSATEKIAAFLKQPLTICGREYRLFFLRKKESETYSAHYFATHGAGLEGREVLLAGLYEWLISLKMNRGTAAPKLWSRISLSLSSTTATLVFSPEQIRLVRDVSSETGECMTDGCAKASPAVFKTLWKSSILALEETPTAVQARIGGAKGVWYIDPLSDPASDDIWIEIRESQLKYKYESTIFEDPTLRTLDVCNVASVKPGGNINNQFIGILSHCGVPTYLFQQLLEDHLKNTLGVVNAYLDNPILLRNWIASLASIYDIRCNGSTYNDSNTEEDALQEPYCITYNEAGVPTMLHEVAVSLLESGFLPKTNSFLRERVRWALKNATDKLSDKMHILVSKSATMMCIADDTGVLEENQVSIRFSQPFQDAETGMSCYCITGDVLVARNPALLPTDVQKVQAVDVPELKHLTNVIIFSTKGAQSKLSLLSGGDYDGDCVWTCWDERLVTPFQNKDIQFAKEPPNFVSEYFEEDKRSVETINTDVSLADDFVSYGITNSLVDIPVGQCNDLHTDLVYTKNSHEDPKAITLARLAARLVDAPKQGIRLRIDKWTQLLGSLRTRRPEYKKGIGESRNSLSLHVMDVLVLVVIPTFQNDVLGIFNKNVGGGNPIPLDKDILEFYKRAMSKDGEAIEKLKDELRNLKGEWAEIHASRINGQHKQKEIEDCSPKKSPKKRVRRASSKMDEVRLDELYSKYSAIKIGGRLGTALDEVDDLVQGKVSLADKVKAATAYCLESERFRNDESPFVWGCGGFRALCEIKCNAMMFKSSSDIPMRLLTGEMHISLKPNPAFIRKEKSKVQKTMEEL